MTDGNSRQLTLTPTEVPVWAALAVGESMWIAREGACAPLTETCRGRCEFHGRCQDPISCDRCRIKLVGPCPRCEGTGNELLTMYRRCSDCHGMMTVTLGYAYATGEPLPIVGERNDGQRPRIEVTDQRLVLLFSQDHNPNFTLRLAHYGPPESLPGQWAIEVRKA